MKAEHIHNAAAYRELSTRSHLRNMLVARIAELFQQSIAVTSGGALDCQFKTAQLRFIHNTVLKRRSREQDDTPLLSGLSICLHQPLHHAEPFSHRLRVWQRALDGSTFQFREEICAGKPLTEFVVKLLLRANVRAHEPQISHRFFTGSRNHTAKRCVRIFNDVGKNALLPRHHGT